MGARSPLVDPRQPPALGAAWFAPADEAEGDLRRRGLAFAVVVAGHVLLLGALVGRGSPSVSPAPPPALSVRMIAPPATTVAPPKPRPSPPVSRPVSRPASPATPRRAPASVPAAPPDSATSAAANEALPATPSVPAGVAALPAAPPLPPPLVAARFDAAYLNNPKPAYPPMSRRLGEEGRVVLRVRVGRDGLPLAIDVATPSGYARLDAAARAAVERWRFVPARQGDEAVASSVMVPLNFTLNP